MKWRNTTIVAKILIFDEFRRNLTIFPILNRKTVAFLLFGHESARTVTTAPENIEYLPLFTLISK